MTFRNHLNQNPSFADMENRDLCSWQTSQWQIMLKKVLALVGFKLCSSRSFGVALGYIDVDDGCWIRNVLVTTLACWCPIYNVGGRFIVLKNVTYITNKVTNIKKLSHHKVTNLTLSPTSLFPMLETYVYQNLETWIQLDYNSEINSAYGYHVENNQIKYWIYSGNNL